MLFFNKASELSKEKYNDLIKRGKEMLADAHNATTKELFFYNPKHLLISHLTKSYETTMWKNISKLPNNQQPSVLKSSKIDEIVILPQNTIFKSRNGLCALYDSKYKFICYLNSLKGELIRSVYFNTPRNEVIKVSVVEEDQYTALHCFAVTLSSPEKCTEIFQDNEISYPGFIEFDSINNRAIILEGRKKQYHIWCLKSYKNIYSDMDEFICDMKLTPNTLLILKRKYINKLTINFRDIENITNNYDVEVPIDKNYEIEFVDCLDVNLIIKQRCFDLKIYNIATGKSLEVPNTASLMISDFLFLYIARKIVIFQKNELSVFSFQGDFLFTISSKRKIRRRKKL